MNKAKLVKKKKYIFILIKKNVYNNTYIILNLCGYI